MLAYARQSRKAENTANVLKFRYRQLELEIETLEEEYKLERAAWIVAHASMLGPDVEKSITSSSVVAMKRNALESQILAEYPLPLSFPDIPAKKLELATLELQRNAARTDATHYKMLFLAALRGFEDIDNKPFDPQAFVEDDELMIMDEINAELDRASNDAEQYPINYDAMLKERIAHDELLEQLAAMEDTEESISDIINV